MKTWHRAREWALCREEGRGRALHCGDGNGIDLVFANMGEPLDDHRGEGRNTFTHHGSVALHRGTSLFDPKTDADSEVLKYFVSSAKSHSGSKAEEPKQMNTMKTIKTLAVGTTLGLALLTTTFAQGRHEGPPGGPPKGPPGGPPEARANPVKHLTEIYTMVAPFDVNVDDQLDTNETAALATAISNGTVKGPPHPMPPKRNRPKPAMIANHLAELYATLAPYDSDQDGLLDATEQAALQDAMDNGELPCPGGPPH